MSMLISYRILCYPVPQKPLSVAALVQSSREITVTWSQPIPRPGVTIYHVKAYAVVNGTIDFVKISNVSGLYLNFL